MEQLHSQQSIVRTDFTLKYYHLESLLKAHDVVKITGSDRHVFVRSWMDYVKAKGDGIVTWADGDFDQLLAAISHYSGEEIVDEASLTEYLNQQTSELIFCVDSQNIEADQLQSLCSILSSVDKRSASIEAFDADTSEAGNNDLENEPSPSQSQLHIKLVLCMPDIQKASSVDQLIDSFNAATFQVGEAGGNRQSANTTKSLAKKTSDKKQGFGKSKVLLLLLLVALGLGWHFKQNINNHFKFVDEAAFTDLFGSGNRAEISNEDNGSVNDADTSETAQPTDLKTAGEIADDSLDDLKGVAASVDNKEQPLKEVVEQTVQTSSPQVDKVVGDNAIVNESSADDKVDGSVADSPTADGQSIIPPKENLVIIGKAVDPPLNPEKNSKPSVSETVAISSAKSANSVNLGSSIRTQSKQKGDASKSDNSTVATIDQLVDGWIDAWQTQDFDKYQQFYSDDFKSGGQRSHARWLKWRKKRIEKPKWIKLSRSNIKHLSEEASELYQIQLTLIYSSPNYRDKTFKRMTFKKLADSTFKIVKEENLKVTKG